MRPKSHKSTTLDEHLNGATHVSIWCGSFNHCGYEATWLTSRLVEAMPGAVTVGDFESRLRCKRCGIKGWAYISAARR